MSNPPRVPAARIVFSDSDRAEILAMVDESLSSGSLTLGPRTKEFEDAFAAHHGTRFAVATSSGTSALEIILRSIGIEGGDVIVPATTFFATAAAVRHGGGRPTFADIDAATFALSPATIEAAITPDTVGVVLVHIGGVITPAVDEIRALCDRRGLFLVEDAAHAHGAALDGRLAGTFGRAAAFSFYPTKVITSGEGGMIVTEDEALAAEARCYRDQGKADFLTGGHTVLGSNWRMSELHAAVGLVHLRRLDEFITRRRAAAAHYDEALTHIDGISPVAVPEGAFTNYYKYLAMLDRGIERAAVKEQLRNDHGIALSGEVYAVPLHHEPVFAGIASGSFPVAEDVSARHVCLPVHSDMSLDEAELVVRALRAVLGPATASSVGTSGASPVNT